ncbi:hypothetical protein, partial [uncultured Dokdonia sp.]|uniref:beta strand repeat-containing protein n=1 Tax=uncultured Dokdonia sp. TaxID=575653 RepID=UPI0026021664
MKKTTYGIILKRYCFAFFLFLSASFNFYGQTKGLIFDPAGAGQPILDPNGDGYTSATNAGFMSDDETESEIPYVGFPSVGAGEPDSDLGPGPSCGFTDLVRSADNNSTYSYLDASDNLLFRFRLGGAASNSKGYSILIDTDESFGFSGPDADPNAVPGNPGFEIEIVLLTNFGVALFDVDGATSGTEIGDHTVDRPFDDFAQKSIALSEICGDDDFFYDFYIPFADITTAFPGITTSTPLRMVGATVINPNSALGNSLSDVSGVDDQTGTDDTIFEEVIDIFPPTPIDEIIDGLAPRANCPTITGPLAVGATSISGTSTEVDGATITVYRDGNPEPITTTVSGGTWTLSGLAPFVANEIFTATTLVTEAVAMATGTEEKSESTDVCNATTVGAVCSPTPIAANLFCSSDRRIVVTGLPSGATIRFYNTVTGLVGTAVENGTTGEYAFSCNGNFNTGNCNQGGNCGSPLSGIYYYTVQEPGNCESNASPFICITGTPSQLPTITTSPILETTSIITGTLDAAPSGTATITLYINGVVTTFMTTTSGTTWSISGISGLMAGDSISVFNQEVGECPQESVAISVQTQSIAPIIEGTFCTSTGFINEVSGTSSEIGATINIYTSTTSPVAIGTSIGTTIVATDGSWTVTGLSIPVGNYIAATATNTGDLESDLSNEVQVFSQTTDTATIDTTPLEEGDASVSGTTTAPDGSIIQLYIDDTIIPGFTAMASGGMWTITGLDAASAGFDVLYAGGEVAVTVQNGMLCESNLVTGPIIGCRLPVNQSFSATTTTVICEGDTITFEITTTENLVVYELIDQAGNGVGPAALGDGSALVLTTFPLTTSITSITVNAQRIGGILCETILSPPIDVTVNVLPEIDLTSNMLDVCEGDTSVDLAYLIIANGPAISYSIDYDMAAETEGFSDIIDDTNFTSPITLSIPSGIPAGTYTGSFTIKNSNSIECESSPEVFTIVVNSVPVISISSTSPTSCGGTDGIITLSGLSPSTLYDNLIYDDNSTTVNAGSFTSNASGEFEITGLAASSYSNIIVTLNGCDSNIVSAILSDPGAPIIGEGTHINPTSCITPNGTIIITGVTPGTYDVSYSFNGVAQPTQNITTGTSEIQVNGLEAGDYTNISVTDAMGCQSNTIVGPITLTNTNSPTITLGTNPTVSSGTTTANLPYTSTTNSPDQYLIDFDTAANAEGFVDITTPTSLPSSPIVLTIPGGATPGVYNGTITVINSSTGCISTPVPFTVTVTISTGCTPPSAPSVTFNPDTYCIGETITAPTATGTALQWYSDAALTMPISTVNPAAPTIAELNFLNTVVGMTTVYVTQTISCESAATVVTLTVNQVPDISTTDTPSVCSGDSFDLTTITITDANSTSASITYHGATPAMVGNELTNSTVSPIVTTTYYILATTTDGCIDELPVTLTVNQVPDINTTDTPTICSGDSFDLTTVTITDANSTSASITYHSATPAMLGNELTNSTVSPTVTTTYYILATTTNGCTDELPINVVVQEIPTVEAGDNIALCSDFGSYTLVGSSIGGGATEGTWSITQPTGGDGTVSPITATASPDTATFSATVAGVYVLTLTTDATAPCTPATDTVTITVEEAPTVDAGPATASICSNGMYTVTGGSSSNGTILWTTSGSGTYDDATIDNPVYTPSTLDISAGVVTLTKTVTATGACATSPAVDTVALTINEEPTVAAGDDIALCNDFGSYTLVGSSIGGGATEGTWSITQPTGGDGTVSPTTATTTPDTATFSATVAGVYVLTLTTDATAPCTPATDTVTITVEEAPTVDAGPATASICSDEMYTVTGGSSSNGTILWTTSGSGTYDDATIDNPVYTPSDLDISSGVVTLTKTVTATGACSSSPAVDTVALTINEEPTVAAGDDIALCNDFGSYTLVGSSIGGGATEGTWSITQPTGGDGTVSPITATASPDTATFSATVAGVYVLTLTTDATAPCTPATDTVTITVEEAPTVDAGPATASICSDEMYTVTGGSSSNGTISWTTSGSGIFNNTTIDNPVYTPSALDITAGMITLTKTVKGIGACSSSFFSDDISLTINEEPTVAAGDDIALCNDFGSYTLVGSSIGGGATEGTWSITQPTGGDGTVTPLTATTTPDTATFSATVAGVYVLTLTTDATAPCTPATDTVTITVEEAPTVDAGPATASICSNGMYTVTGGSSSNGTILWTTSGSGTYDDATIDNPVYTPSTLDISAGVVTLTKTVTATGACSSSPAVDTVALTINEEPTVAAGDDIALCNDFGSYTLVGSSIGGGATEGTWSITQPTGGDGTV